MPQKFPPHIGEYIKQHFPTTHRMWWMRARVLEVVQNQDAYTPNPYFRYELKIADIDHNFKAYSVITNTASEQFMAKDCISLFGHEPLDATTIGTARLFFVHDSGTHDVCYPFWTIPKAPTYGMVRWKADEDDFMKKFIIAGGSPSDLLNSPDKPKTKATDVLGAGAMAMALGPVALFVPKFQRTIKGAVTSALPAAASVDVKPLYDQVASMIDEYVCENRSNDQNFPVENYRRDSGEAGAVLDY